MLRVYSTILIFLISSGEGNWFESLEGGFKNTVVDWGRDVRFGSNYQEVQEIKILPDVFGAISWMCVVCCSTWLFTD